MHDSADYYKHNAASFFQSTVTVDMSALHDAFLRTLPPGSRILDAGCGSGRDAKAFASRGYNVTAFDASPDLAELASKHCGFEVLVRTFSDVSEIDAYDGIWCCASLLHVAAREMSEAIGKLWRALRPGGSLYLSFKLGTGERAHDGRRFTDADEGTLRAWFASVAQVSSLETWITEDSRPDRSEQWINALVLRSPRPARKLVTGGDDPFLPHLSQAMARATEIDIAVAFIKTTGMRLLMPDLLAALLLVDLSGDPTRRVRVLTSDYLDVTDPEALRLLLLLQDQGGEVRVYATKGTSFHLKAYVFARSAAGELIEGTAFIGSSNISRQALQDGLEWNYRVAYPDDLGFLEAQQRFGELFAHPSTVPLSDRWVEDYELRRVPPPKSIAPGSQEQDPPPAPTPVQIEAMDALAMTRSAGFRRGLVVLATGLGKTWLAAFDSTRMGARRVLFVAHREEILSQAAQTFIRVRPTSRVGLYTGQSHDAEVDVLCASVQTLARAAHLERFAPQHFDYVVIDEFHHAAAATYRRLLGHFAPAFLLGLTATPDRTDQSNILSLCDDNLVFTRTLFEGIQSKLLAPFHYFGILDESVDYREVPWRNGRFDPEQLSNKLATLARARHAIKEWRHRAQTRTLAFCVSVVHAEYMTAQFQKAGINSAAVYAGSVLGRTDALDRLRDGRLSVIFSVDLFNEGVDLPGIDTVMMLRPTESKILFLQQLGRGLRRSEGKQHLVVLDFIGNHQSFLQKPQALFGVGATYKALAEFARQAELGRLELPDGCYVNYDLKIIDFLKSLDSAGTQKEYEALRASLGHRPTLAEFYRSGASIQTMRKRYGSWLDLVNVMGDLEQGEARVLAALADLLKEVEVTPMTKSFKMVLLEGLLELDGLAKAPTLAQLAQRSWEVLQRRQTLLGDLPEGINQLPDGQSETWQRYWLDNPIKAWVRDSRADKSTAFFRVENGCLHFASAPPVGDEAVAKAMLQELVDYRLAAYEVRRPPALASNVVPFAPKTNAVVELPYFPNLKIACGHFRAGRTDAEEYRTLPAGYGQLDSTRHFIARASGNSMAGGKSPIHDGDHLLLELVSPGSAGSITGSVMAIERQDEASGDNQYLLRVVTKSKDGRYLLKANNTAYEDLPATDEMRTLARLKAVVNPFDLVVGQSFAREDIPALFGESFNPGSWNVGHVVLNDKKAHVLLVTLNKQGKAEEHRYHDHWVNEHTFHWQSQNATTPASKRGQELIQHEVKGIAIHLFIREAKLAAGKGAPFVYRGKATYVSHRGSNPMSVIFAV
jgi:superfamily II DNA or RNA helicase/HKD family nuclease/protein-L-isoaspartate O-methyltransferase